MFNPASNFLNIFSFSAFKQSNDRKDVCRPDTNWLERCKTLKIFKVKAKLYSEPFIMRVYFNNNKQPLDQSNMWYICVFISCNTHMPVCESLKLHAFWLPFECLEAIVQKHVRLWCSSGNWVGWHAEIECKTLWPHVSVSNTRMVWCAHKSTVYLYTVITVKNKKIKKHFYAILKFIVLSLVFKIAECLSIIFLFHMF